MVSRKKEFSMSDCSSCSPDKKGSCSNVGTGCDDGRGTKIDVREQRITAALDKIKYKLFIVSGKGGVGKSSVSVNIAAGLAAKGNKVGIIDVDIHGPSVPRLLGLSGGLDGYEDAEGKKHIKPKSYNENLYAVSMDSLLKDPDQAVLWRGPMKTSAIKQFISDVDWGELDYLVIDSPPGTGDEHMTVLKTIKDALCVVVTTPQELSLADVRKAVNFLQYAKANILGVVENMSGLICPHCAGEISLFKKGGGKDLADKYGLPFLGEIPLDPSTVVAGDVGTPVVYLENDTPAKKAFQSLADAVDDAVKNSLELVSTAHI